ncbi:sensor histidine kinase [Streptomyces sp. NPDC058045]|uniref:sensor histidine kinase n=1 Tax=Streptomyces sp. NPDC058045 TaxID=3346311 RepID=UPI0036EA7936
MNEQPRPVWRSAAWAIACAVLFVVALGSLTLGGPADSVPYVLVLMAVTVVATILWAWLRTRRQRREFEARLTAWAAQQAVQSERLRVARDLHDLVSHALGLITLRAAAARTEHGTGQDSEQATALADIEDASREATRELRRMLGLLRDETPAPAPLHPAARLDDLPALVETSRRYGLDAELRLGKLHEVTPGVQLAVHAIVREALANTARHAGPAHVVVRVDRDDDTIAVSVHDSGPADHWTARPGAGHGLIGLRERAENLGGTLRAEPTGTGFHLAARLPDPIPV